ncbi:MAG: flagellar filament capping protein FliD [Burkholderiales bacterium]|nr:flagellar filament capping protein FliD [Burkholderiales bacterium]
MSTSSVGSSILGASGISSPGIGSGLDVNGIVTKLMAIESQPITLLNNQQQSYQTQLSALGSVSSSLSSLQGALSGLTNLSQLQSLSATPADPTVLTATAGSGSIPGSYAIGVTTLAQAQTTVATGQTSSTAAIGTGASTTLTFSFGTTTGTVTGGVYQPGTTFTQDPTQPTKTVTINSTNNSLQGIRDAINAANIGVTASIVNDGTASPYRLTLSSSSGSSHSMSIAVAGDATLTGLLNYDPTKTAGAGQNMTQSVSPQNAALTVNGLAISSASNSVTSAISGVTLNLAKIGSTSLSMAYNSASVQSSIQGFIAAYNNVNSTISALTAYNTTTKTGGPLLGDFTTLSVQNGLRNLLSQPLTGLGNASIKNLTQLGITFQKDGSLALNTATLQSAINTSPQDIAGMFASLGQSTDSLVSYVSSTSKTLPGSYAVNVTRLATQGNVAGNVNLNAGITINGTNNVLNITLDGTAQAVTLAQGTYTSAQLASLVQSTINGTAAYSAAGSSVAVSINGGTGFMTIASNRYGSASNVSVTNTSAGTALLGGTGTSTAGLDVTGSINGVTASGSGQNLIGATGSSTEGLTLKVAGGSLGARGTVNFSLGYATQLNNALTGYLSSTGLITSATNGINTNIQNINTQITKINSHLAVIQQNYLTQFTALDTLISRMTQTSNYLTQQLTAMSYTQKNYG